MRSRMMRALTASVAAGMLASGAAVASAGTALAAPATTKVTSSHHAVPDPTKMPHKKCPKGEHLKKVNGKWGCHKK
ncbi:hypothetical protein ABZ723_29245 [Streptomyces sp. NPDC006700]|uniref:hypothetical protein n=1 Tax=unclassified Streptomyces TaxID=2593676 RepID=UPI0033C4C501